MADVKISGLHKRFGPFHAVQGIDLEIADGEFTVLVGPSGCGKSTLLRTIAGLEEASEGTIMIGGEVVNDMRPRDRDVAMVFQDYALYPHLTVERNIGFGLRARKMPADEIGRRVRRVAGMLGITPLLDRYPRQLSGGQRQRVAIGRAIVREPQIFLFDEPLSNLDAQLRDEMRGEIKRLHRDIATTMIYVTHDQIEAMTLADRIVLMRDGRIEQMGSPAELFERPASRFVAGFLGSPRMSFLPGSVVRREGETAVLVDGSETPLSLPAGRLPDAILAGTRVLLGLRPEHVGRARHGVSSPGFVRIDATIELLQPTGSRTFATFRLGETPALAELQAHDVSSPGETIGLEINLNRASVFDEETERAL
ncbi:ABC transporter ATP-binding protein [Inquilinus limosus]|uniref:ABC transporter ATP-binding protein n=1 Tax=Inquilinus limosus TaxID=171674 RepID=UPI0004283B89|nr:sn-glycerol-3-phosphate ABC transporter ATP-binding protein UgpC [Inquilinus limosus]